MATANETLFFEYTERQALGRRLRRLAPDAARALRDLFQNREHLTLDGGPATVWRVAPARLGELASLKPGYVFELPNSLDTVRVVIRANGTHVGHGELVAVADVLGVQLLALETDGFRV